jgi:hypothetical protein
MKEDILMEENIMTEEIAENAVQEAYNNLTAAAEDMDKAVAIQKATEQAVSATKGGCTGKTLLVGGGCLVAGGIAGYAFDHWAMPAIKKCLAKHKAKRAQKKAEKAQKKAAKSGKSEATGKEEAPKPAPANTPADGIDPRVINTSIE